MEVNMQIHMHNLKYLVLFHIAELKQPYKIVKKTYLN